MRTQRQQNDIDCIKWFYPRAKDATHEEEEEFLAHSERGVPITKKNFGSKDNVLVEGKRWRGIHIHELWEQGILEGSVPYFTLLGGEDEEEIPPRYVVDFMKKEMFKGEDAELIEKLYNEIRNK